MLGTVEIDNSDSRNNINSGVLIFEERHLKDVTVGREALDDFNRALDLYYQTHVQIPQDRISKYDEGENSEPKNFSPYEASFPVYEDLLGHVKQIGRAALDQGFHSIVFIDKRITLVDDKSLGRAKFDISKAVCDGANFVIDAKEEFSTSDELSEDSEVRAYRLADFISGLDLTTIKFELVNGSVTSIRAIEQNVEDPEVEELELVSGL